MNPYLTYIFQPLTGGEGGWLKECWKCGKEVEAEYKVNGGEGNEDRMEGNKVGKLRQK